MNASGTANEAACLMVDAVEYRILVLAPVGRDGQLAVRALGAADIPALACHSVIELCRELERGAAGALLTSETLEQANVERLTTWIGRQAAWSDLPILLLAGDTESANRQIETLSLGNVTVLERPLPLSSLLSAVRAARRARQRQYQVRDLLAETEKARLDAERQQAHIEDLNARLQRAMTETHHRVKNNLQIVAALLDMQVADSISTVPVDTMKRLRMHVQMLAAVHDILTERAKQDGQAHFVSAQELLSKLLSLMRQTAPQCRFHYTVEDLLLSAKQGTSLALVTNELISNAMKYGRGEVMLRFFPHDREAMLEVCDDGPGFPDGFDPQTAANTGLELIENLVRWDLAGTVAYTNRPQGGGCVLITVPLTGVFPERRG